MPIEIDLWLWPLDPPAARLATLSAHLDAAEQARRDRFVRPEDAARFAAGRGRLREILGQALGVAPAALPLRAGRQGKPVLDEGPAFNLSHANGWAILATGPAGLDLGVDIEAFRPVEPGVAARFFAPGEVADLDGLAGPDWPAGFFRCWTRKEAVVKAAGLGLGCDLTSFRVALRPGARCEMLSSTGEIGPVRDWRLCHLDLAPNFVGAIAARTGGAALVPRLREGRLPLD